MKKLILISFLVSFTLGGFASGNKKTTLFQGTVTDKQGNPLAGAKIYVPSLEKNIYTDFEGHFSIEKLPLKKQSIKISYISFEEKEYQLDLEQLNSSSHFELRSK